MGIHVKKPPFGASYNTPALTRFLTLSSAVEGALKHRKLRDASLESLKKCQARLDEMPGKRAEKQKVRIVATIDAIHSSMQNDEQLKPVNQ